MKIFKSLPNILIMTLLKLLLKHQAWIDHVNYWPTHHGFHLELIDKNLNKPRLSEEKWWFMLFTGKSSCPENRLLRKRLNNTLNHMTEPVDKLKKTQCQLHMWSAKKGSSTFDESREKPTACHALPILSCSTMHGRFFIPQCQKFGCHPDANFRKI